MKVELHCHTDVFSACSRIQPKELVAMAETCGYDAVFLTDHSKVWSKRELGALQALTERVKLLPGIEITLDEGHDVLILGAQDAEYERMSRASDVLAKAAADGFLTVLAHPFRWGEELAAYCALIDAIEARSCNHGAGEHYRMAQDYAEKYNLQQIYASDAHGLNFMNKFWLETEAQFETPEEFRNLILTGRYENRTRPFDMPLPPPYKAASIDELPDDEVCEFSTEHS